MLLLIEMQKLVLHHSLEISLRYNILATVDAGPSTNVIPIIQLENQIHCTYQ